MKRIKPLIRVDTNGKLIPCGKERGRNTAIKHIVSEIEKLIKDPAKQTIFISHSNCFDDAVLMSKYIEESIGVQSFEINFIGPVIGSHTGVGTLAVFFVGEDRE